MVETITNSEDVSEAPPWVGEILVATESTSNLIADAATDRHLTGTQLIPPGSESHAQSVQHGENPSQYSEETPTISAEASDQDQNAPRSSRSSYPESTRRRVPPFFIISPRTLIKLK